MFVTGVQTCALPILITGVILVSSETLGRKLGNRALIAIERLMGIILVMVSVDFILDGIKQTFDI